MIKLLKKLLACGEMLKKILGKIFEIKAEAKLRAEAKVALEQKKKKDRESPICPSCKKQHTLEELKGTSTIKKYIDVAQLSRTTFIECPDCKEVFCLVVYVDSLEGNLTCKGFSIYDKKEKQNV